MAKALIFLLICLCFLGQNELLAEEKFSWQGVRGMLSSEQTAFAAMPDFMPVMSLPDFFLQDYLGEQADQIETPSILERRMTRILSNEVLLFTATDVVNVIEGYYLLSNTHRTVIGNALFEVIDADLGTDIHRILQLNGFTYNHQLSSDMPHPAQTQLSFYEKRQEFFLERVVVFTYPFRSFNHIGHYVVAETHYPVELDSTMLKLMSQWLKNNLRIYM